MERGEITGEELFPNNGAKSQNDRASASSSDFVELTLESQIHDGDPLHSDGEIPEFQIVTSGTIRKSTLLIDSRGYSYTVKSKLGETIMWQCTVRNKSTYCTAIVKQSGSNFTYGTKEHTHEPRPRFTPRKRSKKSSRKSSNSEKFDESATANDSQQMPMPMIILEEQAVAHLEASLEHLQKDTLSSGEDEGQRSGKYNETNALRAQFLDYVQKVHQDALEHSYHRGSQTSDSKTTNLLWLESMIPKRRLAEFRRAEGGVWDGDTSALELYHVWKTAASSCQEK